MASPPPVRLVLIWTQSVLSTRPESKASRALLSCLGDDTAGLGRRFADGRLLCALFLLSIESAQSSSPSSPPAARESGSEARENDPDMRESEFLGLSLDQISRESESSPRERFRCLRFAFTAADFPNLVNLLDSWMTCAARHLDLDTAEKSESSENFPPAEMPVADVDVLVMLVANMNVAFHKRKEEKEEVAPGKENTEGSLSEKGETAPSSLDSGLSALRRLLVGSLDSFLSFLGDLEALLADVQDFESMLQSRPSVVTLVALAKLWRRYADGQGLPYPKSHAVNLASDTAASGSSASDSEQSSEKLTMFLRYADQLLREVRVIVTHVRRITVFNDSLDELVALARTVRDVQRIVSLPEAVLLREGATSSSTTRRKVGNGEKNIQQEKEQEDRPGAKGGNDTVAAAAAAAATAGDSKVPGAQEEPSQQTEEEMLQNLRGQRRNSPSRGYGSIGQVAAGLAQRRATDSPASPAGASNSSSPPPSSRRPWDSVPADPEGFVPAAALAGQNPVSSGSAGDAGNGHLALVRAAAAGDAEDADSPRTVNRLSGNRSSGSGYESISASAKAAEGKLLVENGAGRPSSSSSDRDAASSPTFSLSRPQDGEGDGVESEVESLLVPEDALDTSLLSLVTPESQTPKDSLSRTSSAQTLRMRRKDTAQRLDDDLREMIGLDLPCVLEDLIGGKIPGVQLRSGMDMDGNPVESEEGVVSTAVMNRRDVRLSALLERQRIEEQKRLAEQAEDHTNIDEMLSGARNSGLLRDSRDRTQSAIDRSFMMSLVGPDEAVEDSAAAATVSARRQSEIDRSFMRSLVGPDEAEEEAVMRRRQSSVDRSFMASLVSGETAGIPANKRLTKEERDEVRRQYQTDEMMGSLLHDLSESDTHSPSVSAEERAEVRGKYRTDSLYDDFPEQEGPESSSTFSSVTTHDDSEASHASGGVRVKERRARPISRTVLYHPGTSDDDDDPSSRLRSATNKFGLVVQKRGYFGKVRHKRTKRRYFELDSQLLSYYPSEAKSEVCGSISLEAVQACSLDDDARQVRITTSQGRDFTLVPAAEHIDDIEAWLTEATAWVRAILSLSQYARERAQSHPTEREKDGSIVLTVVVPELHESKGIKFAPGTTALGALLVVRKKVLHNAGNSSDDWSESAFPKKFGVWDPVNCFFLSQNDALQLYFRTRATIEIRRHLSVETLEPPAGWLHRREGGGGGMASRLKPFKRRYYQLHNRRLQFSDSHTALPTGYIDLGTFEVQKNDRGRMFSITTSKSTYMFRAPTAKDLTMWVTYLENLLTVEPQSSSGWLKQLKQGDKEGYLFKVSGTRSSKWQRRWFVLADGFLSYFKVSGAGGERAAKGHVPLFGESVSVAARHRVRPHTLGIVVSTGNREYLLHGDDDRVTQEWLEAIRQHKAATERIVRASLNMELDMPSASSDDTSASDSVVTPRSGRPSVEFVGNPFEQELERFSTPEVTPRGRDRGN